MALEIVVVVVVVVVVFNPFLTSAWRTRDHKNSDCLLEFTRRLPQEQPSDQLLSTLPVVQRRSVFAPTVEVFPAFYKYYGYGNSLV